MTVHRIARSLGVVLVCLLIGVIRAETRPDGSMHGRFAPVGMGIDSIEDEDLLDTIITPTFGEFMVHVGVSVPVGMFAATGGTSPGFALPGPAIGLDYSIYADSILLSPRWVSSLVLARNASDVAAVREVLNAQFELPAEAHIEAGPWYSLTAMTGFEFKFLVVDGVRFSGIGQLGFGIGKSSEVVLASEQSALVQKSNVSAAAAFGAGVGLSLHDRYSVGLRYNSLRITYNLTTVQPDHQPQTMLYDQPMSSFYFFAGFVL